jgi:intracellular septation protein
MKPTIINIIFASGLIIGKIFFNKNFLKFFFKTAFQLDEMGWDKLNFRWAYFFFFLAFLNEIVWRTQPETTWVNFKVWGMLPITFIFTALQLPLINRHKI